MAGASGDTVTAQQMVSASRGARVRRSSGRARAERQDDRVSMLTTIPTGPPADRTAHGDARRKAGTASRIDEHRPVFRRPLPVRGTAAPRTTPVTQGRMRDDGHRGGSVRSRAASRARHTNRRDATILPRIPCTSCYSFLAREQAGESHDVDSLRASCSTIAPWTGARWTSGSRTPCPRRNPGRGR